ncbi:MAG: fibrobacter succinogenes major paralogous domain-containing protein, partial [Prevotella sp.]|nr:fibrobacter succinogenes major paralogous domain-containing protein [Prevotella sp.]
TYSGIKVRQGYKITLPKTTYPVEGTLTIKDEKTGLEKELAITSVPDYDNTNLKPVRVNDKYWAPVNIGAISTTYSSDRDGCGDYFQWGRNVAFSTYGSSGDTYGGPVTAETPAEDYADKFITHGASPYNWLSPKDDYLWSGAKAQGPCPDGWRVPVSDEFTGLASGVFADSRLKIQGDVSGKDLYLPAAGNRSNYSHATWSYRGAAGHYWSSTVSGNNATKLAFSDGVQDVTTDRRAAGASVRCIQE